MNVLELENVTKSFGGLTAISDVTMHFETGELVGLIGPNGAGKTTLFNLITGVYTPTSGTMKLVGDKKVLLNGKSQYKVACLGIARTFQNIRLFSEMTVLDNVLVALHNNSDSSTVASILRLPHHFTIEKALRAEAMQLLALFDLEDEKDELAKNLPYGKQRYLEIIRALATQPKVLFLDEPAAGMNPQETDMLTAMIAKIQKDYKLTVVLIEHDMSLVMEICDRIYVLDQGRKLAEGTPEEVRENPAVIRAYLGGEM